MPSPPKRRTKFCYKSNFLQFSKEYNMFDLHLIVLNSFQMFLNGKFSPDEKNSAIMYNNKIKKEYVVKD